MNMEVFATRLACFMYSIIGLTYMVLNVNQVEEIKLITVLVSLGVLLAMIVCLNKGKWYLMTISPNSYSMSIIFALICANICMFSVTDTSTMQLALARYVYASVGYGLTILATVLVR